MNAWLDDLAGSIAAGTPAVLVTVAGVQGSAPREAGAAMIVTAWEALGTIGGGRLEYRAIRRARTLLQGGPRAHSQDVPLGPDLGQCCGGRVILHFLRAAADDRIWLDPLRHWLARGERVAMAFNPDDPAARRLAVSGSAVAGDLGERTRAAAKAARRVLAGLSAAEEELIVLPLEPPVGRVFLFGAGHVGRAFAAILGQLPLRAIWIDERADAFPLTVPGNIAAVRSADPAAEMARMPPGAFCFVMTHSHARDYALVAAALRRGDTSYLGLIGSATKRARFLARLRAEGFGEAALLRLICPIGGGDIPGKEPGTIALAAAAELMRRMRAIPGRVAVSA